jgi:cold-inducible RNA-binding protein
MRIYAAQLPYELREIDLRDAFAIYGEVEHVTICRNRETGESRGFGFIEMAHHDEGLEAIRCLDGSQLQGRRITVEIARPRERTA